jgi:biotin carboxyl carrier protein
LINFDINFLFTITNRRLVMPVDQAVAATVTAATEATQLAADATQVAVDAAQAVTPDHVGSVLDTLVSIGQTLNPAQGTTLAIIVAVLVVVRMVWKKYQASKK